jgi:uncharacterized protein (TIGR03437 family)
MISHKFFPAIASAVLSIALPLSALADLTGTTTLSSNATLNLNAGANSGCQGDISLGGSYVDSNGAATLSGTYLAPVGAAQLYSIPGAGGAEEFNSLTSADLQTLPYGTTGITNPAVNDVFAVVTNAGSLAKVLVTAASASSVTLQYDTFGFAAGQPAVFQAMNNYSYSSNVAQGSLFMITGCGLATPGSTAVLQDSTKGLPLTLNGASVSVTVNGVTTQAPIYYATPTQIAAVLPSTSPSGVATFSVQYNGQTSNSIASGVWETSFGFGSVYQTGSGPSIATDASYQLLTPTHSASPGQVITFWGSGLGASPQDSDTVYTTNPHGISVPLFPLQVLIGNIPAPISYQGRSGYPGLDQINVTVPAGVPPGCAVSVVAINSNYQIVSNTVTLPVAAGGGSCTDPVLAISPQQLATLSAKSTVNVGVLAIEPGFPGVPNSSFPDMGAAMASFFSMPGSSFGGWASGQYLMYPAQGAVPPSMGFNLGLSQQVSLGSCVMGTGFENFYVPLLPTLDAGAVTVTGAGGVTALTEMAVPPSTGIFGSEGEYLTALGQADGFGLTPTGGTFTFNAAGGQDIGAFTATVNLPIQETFAGMQSFGGQSLVAVYEGGQTITWTGGTPGEFVTISGTNQNASFTCNAVATDGRFTIPSSVLVPMVTTHLSSAPGTLSMQVSTYPQIISAPGLDVGYVFGYAIPVQLEPATYD